MIEGLLISAVGMVVVFVVLAILMFMIMGMGRLLSDRGAVNGATDEEPAAIKEEIKAKIKAEDTAEVAAIILALASYLRERGKALGKSISIDGVLYQVDVGDLSYSPVPLIINEDSYRGAVGDEGLPAIEKVEPRIFAQARGSRSGLGWRSAYFPPQGKYWSRHGWTGRAIKMRRE
jgi:sodium pump decarboxylase gamma subunit